MVNRFLIGFLLCVCGWSCEFGTSVWAAEKKVAIIRDGPSAYFDRQEEMVRIEMPELMQPEDEVTFVSEGYSAGWDLSKIFGLIKEAEQDPDIDAVLVLSIVGTMQAMQHATGFSKPIVCGMVQEGGLVKLPYNEDRFSTVPNLTYVVSPIRIRRDLSVFKDLGPIDKVAMMVDAVLMESLPGVEEWVDSMSKDFDLEIVRIGMAEMAAPVVKEIKKAKPDAVYLTPGFRMSAKEHERLIAGVNDLKLPSLSMLGHEDVRRGVMAGLAPDFYKRSARRLALNLRKVLGGISPNEISVDWPVEDRLLVNYETAQRIGWPLPFDVINTAEMINKENVAIGEPLDLERAVVRALEENPLAEAMKASLAAAGYQARQARSGLLPQLNGTASYTQIDEDRAVSSMGQSPEKASKVGVSLNQSVYNPNVWNQVQSSKVSLRSALADYQRTLLDITADTVNAYYTYLEATAAFKVEVDNLKRTRKNLSQAKVREYYGSGDLAEVYRWENEEAVAETAYNRASANVQVSRHALNRTMGTSDELQWQTEHVSVENPDQYIYDGQLASVIKNEREFVLFITYCGEWMMENSPDLELARHQVELQQLALKNATRNRWSPKVGIGATYDYHLEDEYAGLPPDSAEPDVEEEWVVAATAELPFFAGGGKAAEVAAEKARLIQAQKSLEDQELSVMQRLQTAMDRLTASYPNIATTQTAADRALKNLEIISDKYSEGRATILDVLDAQTQANSAQQQAVIASYTFLKEISEYQRSMGWYPQLVGEKETQRWVNGAKKFIQEQKNEKSKKQ